MNRMETSLVGRQNAKISFYFTIADKNEVKSGDFGLLLRFKCRKVEKKIFG